MRKSFKLQEWIIENTNKHLCECGCGQIVKPNKDRYYDKQRRWFINLHQNRGKNHPRYRNGEVTAKGYVWIWYTGGHPRKTPRGYVKRCWLVMEKKLGRYLKDGELVHHINENKTDDRPQNLMVVNDAEHAQVHFHKHMYQVKNESVVLVSSK